MAWSDSDSEDEAKSTAKGGEYSSRAGKTGGIENTKYKEKRAMEEKVLASGSDVRTMDDDNEDSLGKLSFGTVDLHYADQLITVSVYRRVRAADADDSADIDEPTDRLTDDHLVGSMTFTAQSVHDFGMPQSTTQVRSESEAVVQHEAENATFDIETGPILSPINADTKVDVKEAFTGLVNTADDPHDGGSVLLCADEAPDEVGAYLFVCSCVFVYMQHHRYTKRLHFNLMLSLFMCAGLWFRQKARRKPCRG